MFGVIKNELITIHFSYLYIIKINMNEEGLPWWFRVENLSAMEETPVQFLGQEDLLEKV